MTLNQTLSAVAPNIASSFQAAGGTPPYSYLVRPNGAGGVIDSASGIYTAPAQVGTSPQTLYDVVQATDSVGSIAIAKILVGTPLFLLCDIIQTYLGLQPGRVYLWDQKIMQPVDSGLYVAVSVPNCRPFGNNVSYDSDGNATNTVNMLATIDLDIISRGPAARDQKEQVLMAILSTYSQQQQEANSFFIGRLPAGARFTNLSAIDGTAIPYRYKISFNMQYAATSQQAVSYFDQFVYPSVYTDQ